MNARQRAWRRYHQELEAWLREHREWERGDRIGPEPERPDPPGERASRSPPRAPLFDADLIDRVRSGELSPERSCHGKRQYSASRAQRFRNEEEARLGVPMRAYPCPFCNKWHLTKQRPGRSRR